MFQKVSQFLMEKLAVQMSMEEAVAPVKLIKNNSSKGDADNEEAK
jgi:hypothetical protein